MSGWAQPRIADYYEAFCRRHPRYREANAALVAHAHLAPGMQVLDLAAGTGRTAEAALPQLGDHGRVLCVEPSDDMRSHGMQRLTDERVRWSAALPAVRNTFDRILCGAALWQLTPLAETFAVLADTLRPGGALCFNMPATYLLEPDEPGGGSDPLLLSLPATLMTAPVAEESSGLPAPNPLSLRDITDWASAAGLRAESWRFRLRLTQEAYADWLKIPAVTGRLMSDLPPDIRAQRIDAALDGVDRSSWKWERWCGWCAWKP